MAKEDCLLTHSNPTVVEATEVYVQALASLIKGVKPEDVQEEAGQNVSSSLIRDILQRARQAPTPVPLANGQFTEGDKRSVGYFGVALQSAFYELEHATDFASGLEDAVARGGDTDTNGCIVGAMLGARFGADAVPQEWIAAVKNAKARKKTLDFVAVPDAETLVSDLLQISCHHGDSVK
ncbi:ADP-ribosylation/Crystallin J1 [Aphelenchoides avenae]|nr:ADP-ribosylation/Crystallin J1 [Aphelenchus avenae]